MREEIGIAGFWHLSPVTQLERCRYAGGGWFREDSFSDFYVHVNQPLGEDNSFITATYVPPNGVVLSGNWDRDTGAFDLFINTANEAECGHLFFWDGGADLCGDAIGCEFVACQEFTSIESTTSPTAESLGAEANWYYAVTFSYEGGEGVPPVLNTWECEGNATLNGSR